MSFDDMYDEMLHDEFRSGTSRKDATDGPAHGLARYRTAALVSAGGLAAATAGAFLGGLGGYFTVSAASGSPLTSSSTEVPLAAAAQAAYHSTTAVAPAVKAAAGATSSVSHVTNDAPGGAAATFASAVGPLLNGINPLTSPTVSGGGSTSTGQGSSPGTGDGTNTTPKTPLGQVTQILTVNLNDILGNLTGVLNDIVSLPADPTAALGGLITPLSGVLSDVTNTLSDLSSLLPLPSSVEHPAGALGRRAGAYGHQQCSTPSLGAPSTTSGKGSPSPTVSALAPVLNSVAATAGSLTGGKVPALPSLPLPASSGQTPTVPSLPVTTPPSPCWPCRPGLGARPARHHPGPGTDGHQHRRQHLRERAHPVAADRGQPADQGRADLGGRRRPAAPRAAPPSAPESPALGDLWSAAGTNSD